MTDKTPLPEVGSILRIEINGKPTGKVQEVIAVDEKTGRLTLGPIRDAERGER